MQYLLSPATTGPSLKTWPKCAPQFLHITSVRLMPWLRSCRSSICSKLLGSLKLGQPVPESNLVSEEKSSAPQTAHWYIPCSWLFQYFPENGASVPPVRATRRNSGESSLSFFIDKFIFYYRAGKGSRPAQCAGAYERGRSLTRSRNPLLEYIYDFARTYFIKNS